MASKITKTRNTNKDFIKQTNGKFTSGQNARNDDDFEYNGLDEEIKSIFDNLRSAGSPPDYSLDEALVKAIGAEKKLLANKVKISNEKPSFSIFGKDIKSGVRQIFKIWRVELEIEAATMLLLTLGSICLIFILPLKAQEVTENFREIQFQVIK